MSSSLSLQGSRPRLRYHRDAYEFVINALRFTQELLGRSPAAGPDEESGHITGQELLEGIRLLGLRQFGMMAPTVFAHWGVHTTDDFGRIVFELVEREELRRTERDQLSDFADVYSFDEVFRRNYRIDTSKVFRT
jgi:uncharacterized repeat protein (TIGR04138 family)|uniref:Uncharacterized protein n=1 Tax=Schlesneria paludicola TaxID=360056 RepID=A0A7C4QH05_9PLAN